MSQFDRVLALNGGSSSLKYALFDKESAVLRGSIDIGANGAKDQAAAVQAVFGALEKQANAKPNAVGHRMVHGGPDHDRPARLDKSLRAALDEVVPYAPLHLPSELKAIDAVSAHFGDLPQVVCFDTSFHRTMPERARRYALPTALYQSGVRRYGFHGLSYEYVVASIGARTLGRSVIAHLGSGASMVAVRDGQSIDTTMGFTPTAGLVMGTRSGDVDPGLLVYLLEHRGYSPKTIDTLLNHESGLLAISETTADMRKLLAARATDARAALAIDLFCYQARKWVGAFASALEGLDSIVFTGGIGEHAQEIRAEICRGLGYLGVAVEDAKNTATAKIISTSDSRVAVHVIETDEERMVARHTRRVLEG